MSVDLALRISGKLAGDWSASNVVGHLTAEAVDSLSAPAQWEALDPLVRTRLLLAPLFLRGAELGPLRPALRRLRAAAAGDQDEWVRATAAAVGDYDGALHMEALAKESKLVRRTLEDLRARLQGADPALSRPLEEQYLSDEVLERRRPGSSAPPAVPPHAHFTPRDPATAPDMQQHPAPPAAAPAAAAGGGPRAGAAAAPPPPPPVRPGPAALPAPGGRRPLAAGEDDLFLPRKPLAGGVSRPGGGLASRVAARSKKVAAVLDPSAVAEMNRAAAAARERAAREAAEAKEADARARAEAKAAEKAAKERGKEAQRAAAKEAQHAAREEERAAREAEGRRVKEEEARQRAEQKAAGKAAEAAVKAAAKAAERAARDADKAERKRSGGGGGGGNPRPPKKPRAGGGGAAGGGGGGTQLDDARALQEYYSAAYGDVEEYDYDDFGRPVEEEGEGASGDADDADADAALPAGVAGGGGEGGVQLMTPEEAAQAIEDAALMAAAERAGIDPAAVWGGAAPPGGG